MTFTDAAREVLRLVGRPLHYKEITEIAIERNLLSHVGKSPDVTMGARLAATLKKEGEQNPLVRVKPGVFALREWDEETIRSGLEQKKPAAPEAASDDPEQEGAVASDGDSEAEPSEEQQEQADDVTVDETQPSAWADDDAGDGPTSEPEGEDEASNEENDWGERSPDEEARAEIAAAASELFAEEDDDDQPILRPIVDDAEGADDDLDGADGGGEAGEGRRRRRRRRRRGSRQAAADGDGGTDEALPTYTTAPAFPTGGAEDGHRPQVIEVAPSDGPSPDSLAGRELADMVALILTSFERTAGPVSLRQIADAAQRRGKVGGDVQSIQSHVAASTRADNARRLASGLRPRFRLAGGRIGLTDWLLDGELTRLERDALASLQRYRDGARRALARRLADLPGHSFVELCLLILERVGVSHLHPVRFAGSPGSEAHYTGLLNAPAGALGQAVGVGEPPRIAVLIRKDGRDLGRERVTELRGSAHHYGSCALGWILTSGQILSGAREEANVVGALPVTLFDALALARLCEEHGVGTVTARFPVAIPDVDLFEALRSS